MSKLVDLLFEIQFFKSKLNDDKSCICLFRTSKTVYERYYPHYPLQSEYPIQKLLILNSSPEALKPIITAVSGVQSIEQLDKDLCSTLTHIWRTFQSICWSFTF